MNPAAKQVAAIDAAIEQKYGADSPEAARMKVAAREAIAQTLERGAFVARRAFARSNSAAARHAISSAPLRTEYRRISNGDRNSVVEGKSVSVRVDLGGRRTITKTTTDTSTNSPTTEQQDTQTKI